VTPSSTCSSDVVKSDALGVYSFLSQEDEDLFNAANSGPGKQGNIDYTKSNPDRYTCEDYIIKTVISAVF